MAILQNILRSALCTERSILLSSRCMSGLSYHHNPPTINSFVPQDSGCSHKIFSRNTIKSASSNSLTGETNVMSLIQRIDIAILPMSPVERLIKFQLPTTFKHVSLEMPTTKASLDNAHINQKVVEIKTPPRGRVIKQLAIRMLVVRRRKMKKHQRKKFLKKFRVHLMTLARKRKVARETLFLSGLERDFKLAEAFSAEEYAAEKLRRAYEPLPQKEKFLKPLPWEFQPLFHRSKKNGK